MEDNHLCQDISIHSFLWILRRGSINWIFHFVGVEKEDGFITVFHHDMNMSEEDFVQWFNTNYFKNWERLSDGSPTVIACERCRAKNHDQWVEDFSDFISNVYESMDLDVINAEEIPNDINDEFNEMFKEFNYEPLPSQNEKLQKVIEAINTHEMKSKSYLN
jgi:hypothetical protein